MKTFEKVYQVVRTIPAGRVMTYGQVAKIVGTTPRVVGYALRVNPHGDPQGKHFVPCHRVVFKDGSLAKNYAFGGEREQRAKLVQEGVDLHWRGN